MYYIATTGIVPFFKRIIQSYRSRLLPTSESLQSIEPEKRNTKIKESKRKIKEWDNADRVAYANIIILDTEHQASAITLYNAF